MHLYPSKSSISIHLPGHLVKHIYIPHSLLILLSLGSRCGDSPSGGEPATSPRLESLLACLVMVFSSSADVRRSSPEPKGLLNPMVPSEVVSFCKGLSTPGSGEC